MVAREFLTTSSGRLPSNPSTALLVISVVLNPFSSRRGFAEADVISQEIHHKFNDTQLAVVFSLSQYQAKPSC